MKFVNMTPRVINVHSFGHRPIAFPPSGEVARVETLARRSSPLELDEDEGWVETHEGEVGNVTALPSPREGVSLVVSADVRLARPHRHDLYSPGDPVRDLDGVQVGCRGLVRN